MENITIILVGTTHPGNIGATARAMKTMGLKKLKLVNPKIFPSAEVTARAAGADDILASSHVYEDLRSALADHNMVLATSARSRNIQWPVFSPGEAATELIKHATSNESCAVVFGRESSGLSNDELELCNAMIQIPSNPDYSSLNLASAVQIISYEIYKQHDSHKQEQPEADSSSVVSNQKMEQFYEHLEACLIGIGFYDPDNPKLLMRRLRRLFNRARLEEEEYSILRGIIASVENKIKQ